VAQFGVAGDERFKPEGSKWSTVVGHQRHHRKQLTGVRIDRTLIDEPMPEQRLVVGEGEFDGFDRIELIRRRRDMPR